MQQTQEKKGKNIFSKIQAFWKNKWKILQGIYRSVFKNHFVESVVLYRKKLCESNVCGLYSPLGVNENCYVVGEPCCGGCGCKLAWKHRSLSSHCHLKDVGKEPLWNSIMTEEEEKAFRDKTGLKND